MKKYLEHILRTILPAIFMVGGTAVCAQNTPEESTTESEIVILDSANFVKASLMIAEPYDKYIQSNFGHTFLRMQCAEAELDYCFSIENGNRKGFIDICMGHYPNRLVYVSTEEYLEPFNQDGRIVMEYPLNITLKDGQRLWQLLDSICLTGDLPYQDYFHHGCSQELIHYLDWAIDGNIIYGKNADRLGNTHFSINSSLLPSNSWIRVLLAMYGSTDISDRELSAEEKTATPYVTATVLGDAQVVSPDGSYRPLFMPVPPVMHQPKTHFKKSEAPPLYYWFVLLLGFVLVACLVRQCYNVHTTKVLAQALDIVLFLGYNAIALTMLAVCLLSPMSTFHGWNWNFLIYNIVPLVVWIYCKCHTLSNKVWRMIYMGYAIWLCLYMLGMFIVGNHFLLEQYLLASAFAARCFFKSLEFNSK